MNKPASAAEGALRPDWTAEYSLSDDAARALIESQFPQLGPVRLELLGTGWDNSAYRVNGEYVFRFPRRQLGAECLSAEIRVLPGIAGRLPLPITAPTFIGQSDAGFPWSFAGYRLLPGRTACVASPDEKARCRAAVPLARFLKQLHAIGFDEATRLHAGLDTLGRLNLERRIPKARHDLNKAVAAGLIDDASAWEPVFDDVRDSRPPAATALVHGDLYARHLLVDDRHELCGVIDWGDVHLGAPAVDLAIAHGFLPPSAHDDFRLEYGPIDDETWRLARFRALSHAAVTLTYAHETGDAALLRESHVVLGHLCGEA